MDLVTTLISAAGGTITGAVGGVMSTYLQVSLEKARIPLEMQKNATERLKIEAQQIAVEIKDAGETRRQEIKTQEETFKAAHENDKATYNIWSVDLVRGLVRPVITMWVVGILSYITYIMWGLQEANIDSEYWREMFRHLLVTWTYLTTTVTMFWFGQRQSRPVPQLK